MERSSETFAWMGEGEPPPFPGLSGPGTDSPQNISSVLVSGRLDPSSVKDRISSFFGDDIPWAVYSASGDLLNWIEAGASAFVEEGFAPESVLATLEGISRLSESVATRNPLSGLPGNTTIAARLRSGVLQGSSMAAYFDISGFKPFNDYYGFSRGDAVLRSLASILTESLSGYFVGHVGGDDFVAVGEGKDFREAVKNAVRIFNGRSGGFYSGRDHAAGGIEALDRTGEFRFYPVMDLTVSLVDGTGCSSVEELAMKAGLEKKRVKGELLPDTVAGFLDSAASSPTYDHFRRWRDTCVPDTVQMKALLETAGILGDTGMIGCLTEILDTEKDYRIRKSAARALGNMACQDSVEALRAAMTDGNVHVRTAATMALPFVLGRESGPLLSKAVDDRNTWVRRAALRGLGISGWAGASAILEKELGRPGGKRYWLNHRQELTAALEGAAFLGDPALSNLVVTLLKNNPGVRKSSVWSTLLTLGGSMCLQEIRRAFEEGDCLECVENLRSFDPSGLSREDSGILESILLSRDFRRRDDRIQVLGLLARIPWGPMEVTRDRLFHQLEEIEDSSEFEAVLQTMQARSVQPGKHHLSSIVSRISRGSLKLSRKGQVSLLRWASTGEFTVTREFLERLLRNDSREVRTAAARAVISLARRHRDAEKPLQERDNLQER
ncbi:MAG: hypothetical protein AVO35_02830 [Candidatus Aegiribacteria sp. MLS_C]|nr:MAG: hypothetical protein AVO35_02830 [Candidatus Aegiribacteria sp. MLS_C]